MKPINRRHLALILSSLATYVYLPSAHATPAAQDQLRIHTGSPTKAGDSLFSYSVEWRIDDGELYRTTGMSFLNPAKIDGEAAGAMVAKKLVTAIKDGMIQLDPHWRGITIDQPRDQAELTIANKAGYSLTNIIVRDYSNQALRFDVADKRFNAAGVQAAIDLVYAADVEYIDNFTSRKAQTASQGDIEIGIEGQNPIVIKTDGKTTKELEQEIARQLAGSRLSETSLFPHIINKDTRNNKPFDGSEVQWSNLDAKAIAIDVRDPSLGVLVKFKYKDTAPGVSVSEPRSMLTGLALAVFAVAGYFWYSKSRKRG